MNKQELRDLVESTDARKLSRIILKGENYDKDIKSLRDEFSHSKMRQKMKKFYTLFTTFLGIGVLLGCLVGCPRYNVYRSGLAGEAELVKAEQNKKIAIEDAKAKLQSAKMLAEADSIRAIGAKNVEKIRAEGMADAMEIENGKLTDKYIQYLWVRNIDKGDKIYISTEAGLPILEAKNK